MYLYLFSDMDFVDVDFAVLTLKLIIFRMKGYQVCVMILLCYIFQASAKSYLVETVGTEVN